MTISSPQDRRPLVCGQRERTPGSAGPEKSAKQLFHSQQWTLHLVDPTSGYIWKRLRCHGAKGFFRLSSNVDKLTLDRTCVVYLESTDFLVVPRWLRAGGRIGLLKMLPGLRRASKGDNPVRAPTRRTRAACRPSRDRTPRWHTYSRCAPEGGG